MTIINTITKPVNVTSVAISSLSAFFKIWLITAVIMPTAAILKMMPISKMLLFSYKIKMPAANPTKKPSFMYVEAYLV